MKLDFTIICTLLTCANVWFAVGNTFAGVTFTVLTVVFAFISALVHLHQGE